MLPLETLRLYHSLQCWGLSRLANVLLDLIIPRKAVKVHIADKIIVRLICHFYSHLWQRHSLWLNGVRLSSESYWHFLLRELSCTLMESLLCFIFQRFIESTEPKLLSFIDTELDTSWSIKGWWEIKRGRQNALLLLVCRAESIFSLSLMTFSSYLTQLVFWIHSLDFSTICCCLSAITSCHTAHFLLGWSFGRFSCLKSLIIVANIFVFLWLPFIDSRCTSLVLAPFQFHFLHKGAVALLSCLTWNWIGTSYSCRNKIVLKDPFHGRGCNLILKVFSFIRVRSDLVVTFIVVIVLHGKPHVLLYWLSSLIFTFIIR